MKSDKKNKSLSQVRIVLHNSIKKSLEQIQKKSKNEKIKDEKIL